MKGRVHPFWGTWRPLGWAIIVSVVGLLLVLHGRGGSDLLVLACFPYAGVVTLVTGSLLSGTVGFLLQLPVYCLVLRFGARAGYLGVAAAVVVVTHIVGMGIVNPSL